MTKDFHDLNNLKCEGNLEECLIVNHMSYARLNYIFKYIDEIKDDEMSKKLDKLFMDINTLYHGVKLEMIQKEGY